MPRAAGSGDSSVRTRVLLVEDDPDLRSALADLLRADGFEVTTAEHGDAALARLRDGSPSPDVIVFDLMMPEKDGWELRVEQKRDPALQRIPVVAISADGSAQAAAIDAAQYLRKPFAYDDLRQAIRYALRNRFARDGDRATSLASLAAGLAHEINNPLTYVLTNLRMVAGGAQGTAGAAGALEEPAAREMLGDAIEGAERIRRVMERVATFASQSDHDRAPIDPRVVANAAVLATLDVIRPHATLVTDLRATPRIVANAATLEQVFTQLLVHAARVASAASPTAERPPSVGIATHTAASGHAIVDVWHDGEPSHSGRGAEPALPGASASDHALVLSICTGAVTSFGGELSCLPRPNGGTLFRTTLPLDPLDAKP